MQDPSTQHTSERVSEATYQHDLNDYLVYCLHVATYDFARRYVRNRAVLDFGCGSGYGVRRLAADAERIDAVDVSVDAVAEATRTPSPPNVSFRVVAPVEDAPLPYPDDAFDTVLSFQVIEHVADVRAYVREVRRVLRPGGTFACATPDRTVRLGRRQRPWNRFHTHEFSPRQLETLLAGTGGPFETVELLGVSSTPAEVLEIEVERYRTMRYATLPFTFPGAPEWWRQAGLRMLKRARTAVGSPPLPPREPHHFGPENIAIEQGLHHTPVVVAVAG